MTDARGGGDSTAVTAAAVTLDWGGGCTACSGAAAMGLGTDACSGAESLSAGAKVAVAVGTGLELEAVVLAITNHAITTSATASAAHKAIKRRSLPLARPWST